MEPSSIFSNLNVIFVPAFGDHTFIVTWSKISMSIGSVNWRTVPAQVWSAFLTTFTTLADVFKPVASGLSIISWTAPPKLIKVLLSKDSKPTGKKVGADIVTVSS